MKYSSGMKSFDLTIVPLFSHIISTILPILYLRSIHRLLSTQCNKIAREKRRRKGKNPKRENNGEKRNKKTQMYIYMYMVFIYSEKKINDQVLQCNQVYGILGCRHRSIASLLGIIISNRHDCGSTVRC